MSVPAEAAPRPSDRFRRPGVSYRTRSYLRAPPGDAAEVAAYDELRQLLREQLGVSPCPSTQALHARLLRGHPLDETAGPATHTG